jgi:hypothetical protein
MPKPKPDKNLLGLDLGKLEEESRDNPAAVFEWGSNLADAKRVVKLTERKLKIRKAEVSKRVRQNPEAYGFEKGTDKSCEAAQDLDTECQNLEYLLIDAEHDKDILQVFFDALCDKRSQIRNLTLQHGQMYWTKSVAGETQNQDQRVAASVAATNSIRPQKKG